MTDLGLSLPQKCARGTECVPHGGQFLSLEGKLGGQTGDKIMKLTAKKQPTKKTSAKIASKINT